MNVILTIAILLASVVNIMQNFDIAHLRTRILCLEQERVWVDHDYCADLEPAASSPSKKSL